MASAPDRSLFRPPSDRRSRRQVKTSLALRLLHQVVGLEHLHYGIWAAGDERSVRGLRRAQQRLSDRMLELVPATARSVLDVGAGTGSLSRALAARGHEVEGLSPDPYQRDLYARELPGRRFHLGRFQEFLPDRRYDVVLSCESAQYIWLDEFFPAVLRAAPGGKLVMCDYFVVQPGSSEMAKSGHWLDAFRERAAEAGCTLELQEDVTEATAGTLELAREWMGRFVRPAIALFDEEGRARHPLLMRCASPVLRRQLAKLDRVDRLVDADEYRRTKRYLLLRFAVPGRGVGG